MSIKVKLRKLSPRQHDMPDGIKVDKINEVAEDFAKEVLDNLGGLSCKAQPDKISYIIIRADRTHTLDIRKKFCCPEFEKPVSVKIER